MGRSGAAGTMAWDGGSRTPLELQGAYRRDQGRVEVEARVTQLPLNELAAETTVIFEESTSGNPNDWTPVSGEQFVRSDTEIVLTTSRGPGKKLYRLKVTL